MFARHLESLLVQSLKAACTLSLHGLLVRPFQVRINTLGLRPSLVRTRSSEFTFGWLDKLRQTLLVYLATHSPRRRSVSSSWNGRPKSVFGTCTLRPKQSRH